MNELNQRIQCPIMKSSEALLPPILEGALKTSQVYDESGLPIPLDSNVSRDEALILNASVQFLKPKDSVEIGLAKDVSTLAILGAIDQNGFGRHVVCDPYQSDYGNAGVEMVRRAGLDRWWEFHRKQAEEVVPTLGNVQFAFIDASHLFDLTLVEFVLIDKKLDEGGVVGFHDMWMPSLQKLLRFILANRAYEVWHPPEGTIVCPSIHSKRSIKHSIYRAINRLPYIEKIVSPEIREPWHEKQISNLVMLRKLHHDNRDWKHFNPF
ncbi:MAG: class I SAM-dependent methyltransferase [Cyanobium sp.]